MTSYHVHTRWSDGVASIEEVVRAAVREGLDEVGISDHYVIYPDNTPIEWSMDTTRLDQYVEEILEAGRRQPAVRVRLGIEVDYLPETIEQTRQALAPYPFDYIIGSVHYIDSFPIDGHRKHWDALTQDQIDATWIAYYERAIDMARSGVFDFAAHLDLPKKFGHAPSVSLQAEVAAALDALAAADMAIEINTSGWSLPAREAYPAPGILRLARKRGIPILINADAHTPRYLTRNFDLARELATDCGYDSVVRYERRCRTSVPI